MCVVIQQGEYMIKIRKEHDEEKERERERQKRRKRKYGQAKLKHAKRGIYSCVMTGSALFLLMILFAIAYTNGGTTAPIIGGVGMSALTLTCAGLYTAIRGFKEREKDYLTCKIGVAVSAAMILCFVGIFCRGLF